MPTPNPLAIHACHPRHPSPPGLSVRCAIRPCHPDLNSSHYHNLHLILTVLRWGGGGGARGGQSWIMSSKMISPRSYSACCPSCRPFRAFVPWQSFDSWMTGDHPCHPLFMLSFDSCPLFMLSSIHASHSLLMPSIPPAGAAPQQQRGPQQQHSCR